MLARDEHWRELHTIQRFNMKKQNNRLRNAYTTIHAPYELKLCM